MRKTVLLSLFLLCAVWAFAQTYPSQTNPSQTNPSPSQTGQSSTSSQTSSGNETTVEGCLNGSSGNYTLTDTSGKTWQLGGDTSKLSDHVGHKIQITGTTSSSSSGSSGSSGSTGSAGSSAGSSGSNETLNVTSMKHISSTCTPSH